MRKLGWILFFTLAFQLQAQAIQNLVLVPGFFNSAIPAPAAGGNPWAQPYFSQDIVQFLSRTGDRVWVVDTLNPLGSVQSNGDNLIEFLKSHRAQMGSDPIVLIGHSAGGLYSLYAVANSSIPVSQVITLSTPFQGLHFLQELEDRNIPLSSMLAPFCLANLSGLRQTKVQTFLSQLTLKKHLRLDVFAGYQAADPVEFWDFRSLSNALIPFQILNGAPSDGIVTVSSSLNASALISHNQGLLDLHVHQNLIPLDHWEFVLDADLFRALGVLNISSLRVTQLKAYRQVFIESGL